MDLAALVADSFGRLGDALAGLPDDAWSRPSLCEGYRVRHVVAHLTMAARYPVEEFRAELAADGFDFQRTSDRLALRDGGSRRPACSRTCAATRWHASSSRVAASSAR